MIEYILQMDDGRTFHFEVDPDRDEPESLEAPHLPEWTQLDYCQCKNCTLPVRNNARCPAAVDISHIVFKFVDVISYERAVVTVKTPERDYQKNCDIQTALRSLIGLVMATGKCPILSQLRPMAIHHLPFGNPQETLFRTVGTYMMKQYFIDLEGGTPDYQLKNLKTFYDGLGTVNDCFSKRLRAVAVKDANLNAIVELFMLSLMVSRSINKALDNLKPLFLQ